MHAYMQAEAMKQGPWGGTLNGTPRDMGIANHIISVTIYYIDAVAVQALDVVYTHGDGKQETFRMGGSGDGGTPVEVHVSLSLSLSICIYIYINLPRHTQVWSLIACVFQLELAEDEYFIKISGHFTKLGGNEVVTQLTLVTNKGNPVSAGTDQSGAAFCFEAENGGKIVGFFGREGNPAHAVGAIGVYYLPPN